MANPVQTPFSPDPNHVAGEKGERGTFQFPTSATNGFKALTAGGPIVAVDGATNLPGPAPSKYSPGSATLGNAGFSRGSELYVAPGS